jgi:hypothetical protein
MSWLSITKQKTINNSNIYLDKHTLLNNDKNSILEKYDSDINDIIWELLCDLKETDGLLTTNRNHYILLKNIYEKHIDIDRHQNDEIFDENNDETYEDFVSWNKNRFAYN